MPSYQPPIALTPTIIDRVATLSEQIGRLTALSPHLLAPQLRRGNRIRTIQASLAIENNTLSVEQVTAVLDGKRVLGLPREIQEVRNAFAAYEEMPRWQPTHRADLLAAHGLLMKGLVDDAGAFRGGGVGIYRGEQLIHMAPPPARVVGLVQDLLDWLARDELHPLVASCVFHYEFEFIHPFSDGNGRMGRLWQTLILSRWQPLLAWLPVETVIRDRQDAYYAALAAADRQSEATPFVEFMLQALLDAMAEAIAGLGHETQGKTQGKTPVKLPDRIMAELRARPEMAMPELAVVLGKSVSAVERAIRQLREQRRLRRVGPAKGGYWQVLD